MIKPLSGGPSFSPPLQASTVRRSIDSNGTSPARVLPHIDPADVDPETRKAAEGMEALFLDYMFKVMRETVPKNDMDLESPASNIYRSLMDSEYAEKISHQGGVGLADQIIAYLKPQGYHLPQGPAPTEKEKP